MFVFVERDCMVLRGLCGIGLIWFGDCLQWIIKLSDGHTVTKVEGCVNLCLFGRRWMDDFLHMGLEDRLFPYSGRPRTYQKAFSAHEKTKPVPVCTDIIAKSLVNTCFFETYLSEDPLIRPGVSATI